MLFPLIEFVWLPHVLQVGALSLTNMTEFGEEQTQLPYLVLQLMKAYLQMQLSAAVVLTALAKTLPLQLRQVSPKRTPPSGQLHLLHLLFK
jgi:hypothetical protein